MLKLTLYTLFITLLFSCGNTNLPNTNLKGDIIKVNEHTKDNNQPKDSLISLLARSASMLSDSFPFHHSLDCTADIYWKIIKRGKASIPFLIASLTDTTMTNIYDHCKNGKLNVGEVSYFALQEIAEFPEFVVTHIQFDTIDENGCWSFYYYLFDNRNKKQLQKMVQDFYNTQHFVFKKHSKKELTACYKQYKIDGKLRWKE